MLQGHQELWEWGAVTCLGPGVATPPPRALLSPGNLRLTDLGGWMLSPTTAMGHPSATPETPGQGVSWVEKGVLGLEGEPWTWRQKLRRKGTADPSSPLQGPCSQEPRGVDPKVPGARRLMPMPSLGEGRVPGRKHPSSGPLPEKHPNSHEK